MQNNQNNSAIALNYFTQPETLQQIGPARLNKFLGQFADDLTAAGSLLPAPESENGNYLSAVGALFASTSFPVRLREALRVLEEAAAPENAARLDAAIQQHIPCVSINQQCPLDCALELWLLAPDALSQFQPSAEPSVVRTDSTPPHNSVPLLSGTQSEIENQNSKIAHPLTDPPTPSSVMLLTKEDHPLTPPPSSAPVASTLHSPFSTLHSVTPWPEPVNGKLLLDTLVQALRRFVVPPLWAAETLALWIVHTFAFQLRDVSTYIGIESPEKQCGKTTLLTVLSELAHRAVTASNISPPAFFRVIEDLCPTLLIDEADTFLRGNEQLKGILNAGYKRKTAFVLRASAQAEVSAEEFPLLRGEGRVRGNGSSDTPQSTINSPPINLSTPSTLDSLPRQSTNPIIHQSNPPSLHLSTTPSHSPLHPSSLDTRHSSLPSVTRFSCWCPKLISQIGRLPDTLADRCIIIRMQRKTRHEECERLRNLDAEPLKQQCARFVLDHAPEIAVARPELPPSLSDRAADIWEPLLALADLAGGDWPQKARQAAVSLSAAAQETNPIGSLLLDIFVLFLAQKDDRMFSRTLIAGLSRFADRPWAELRNGKEITELWLSQQLRPYGVRPRTFRIEGTQAKGYLQEDLMEVFQRYIAKSDLEALVAGSVAAQPTANETPAAPVA